MLSLKASNVNGFIIDCLNSYKIKEYCADDKTQIEDEPSQDGTKEEYQARPNQAIGRASYREVGERLSGAHVAQSDSDNIEEGLF